MKLETVREKIKLIDEINDEIKFLEKFTERGIRSVSIQPNFDYETLIPNEAVKSWLGKDLLDSMERRMRVINERKHTLLKEIGVDE